MRSQQAARLRKDHDAIEFERLLGLGQDSAARRAAARRAAEAIAGDEEPESAFLLDEDEELAAALSGPQRAQATPLVQAPMVRLAKGEWTTMSYDTNGGYGLLVLEGLLMGRFGSGYRVARELLGPGDVFRPASRRIHDGEPAVRWLALEPVALAVLDAGVSEVIGGWPELPVVLTRRAHLRAERLARMLAVSHLPRLEDRLLSTLRYLATHWGRVTREGLVFPVRLTHEALGEMVGAQRPSVSLAMAKLKEQGRIARRQDGLYVLLAAPSAPARADGCGPRRRRSPWRPHAGAPDAGCGRRARRGNRRGRVRRL
jgi:CRP/FNR family transcriptional regulator